MLNVFVVSLLFSTQLFAVRNVVITGAPGTGKTTLIEELKNQDFSVVPEVATRVINLDFKPPSKEFLSQLYKTYIEDFLNPIDNSKSDVVFFDLGAIDCLPYWRHLQLDEKFYDQSMMKFLEINKYDQTVFIIEPDEDIYETNENTSRESFKQSEEIHQEFVNYLSESKDYKAIMIPKKTKVDVRVNFVLEKLGIQI